VDSGEVTLERVEKVSAWAESNMLALVASFDDAFRSQLHMERADPNQPPTGYMSGPTGPSAPTTTNHVTSVSGPVLSAQTHTSHIADWFPDGKPGK
jgi:hypothetical protein